MKKTLMPHIAKLLSSDGLLNTKRSWFEMRRRISQQPHKLEVFVTISDPYSYLLLQVLPELVARFSLQISLYTVRDKQAEMFPDLSKWQANSLQDAGYLAKLYQLEFPQAPAHRGVSSSLIDSFTAQLLSLEKQPDALNNMRKVFDGYWMNTNEQSPNQTPNQMTQDLTAQLESNQNHLYQLGHYFTAMINFAGEWYWGLDRLDHLETRLNKLGASIEPKQVCYDLQTANFCAGKASLETSKKTLVMYYSARSPYSYLGLEQAVKLCNHYQCELLIKPVLPMMMRGMNVPETKKMYIFHDTKREASKLDIPYGFVADPLGKAVENCYELFDFAKSQGKEIDYLLAFSRAVNSQGLHGDNEAGMREIIQRSGLDWQQAKKHVGNQDWRQWVEHNMQELSTLGLWGVPCYQCGDIVTWGQDRLWLIEQQISQA